jgi:hypothetical protein
MSDTNDTNDTNDTPTSTNPSKQLSETGKAAMQGNDEAVAALEKRVEQLREQKQAEEAARLAELQAQKVEAIQEPPAAPAEKTVVTIHPRGAESIEKEPSPETEPRSIEGG